MENNLLRVLDGQLIDEITSELCDFSLEDQNAMLEAQGVTPTAASDYTPVLGEEFDWNLGQMMKVLLSLRQFKETFMHYCVTMTLYLKYFNFYLNK